MKRIFYSLLITIFCTATFTACQNSSKHAVPSYERVQEEDEEDEGYDSPAERDRFEFERTKDPRLGYVPKERMLRAIDYTENLKNSVSRRGLRTGAFDWVERGPIFDTVGPSNGNIRGASRQSPGTYTSGRTRAILIDTLNDPSGNTVFCGSVSGGLWKCTNFLSTIPNWRPINDRFDNLAISYICQDPTNPAIMYFSTGEPYANADAVNGLGIWRSMDAGNTWTRLMSTTNFMRTFKIICDNEGFVYLALRVTTAGAITPVTQTLGLVRSKDRGVTWENITPNPLPNNNATCTDIELSSTGRLHASFGYNTGGTATRVGHVYTTTPATVTPANWSYSTGIRSTGVSAIRLELATLADTLYGVTVNSAANADSVYKSVDGGATWTRRNTGTLPTGILNGQGWYNLTLAINPSNSNEVMVGGLDAYRSTNSGATFTRATFWVGPAEPYVHADHHFMQWWNVGNQSRIVIGCDGGVYVSNNAGATFTDKNRNLAIKQFYDAAIHPGQGVDYIIGGTQDNGTHQIKNPGLTHSIEVTGGDGAFVHINQQNPRIQFATYIFNQYRRSVDGGATWAQVNLSGTMGAFINQYDYDGGKNTLYASWASGAAAPNRQILRWRNAHISNTDTSILTVNQLVTRSTGTPNNATSFKVSPYTRDRVYIAGNKGAVVRLDSANSVTNATMNQYATNITGAGFDTGYVSCVNVGSSDSVLLATFSSYGVKHVWVSNNGGTSWTNVDGTIGAGGLPDMPVRWAVFDPQNDKKVILATEAGVYTTEELNGANTVWTADVNFPTVRTDRLALRLSDNTIVAATHGRGIFTAVLPSTPEVRFNAPFVSYTETTTSSTAGCRNYRDTIIDISMISPPTGDAIVNYRVQAGNTATEGIDFDFTTNGSFSSPSKQQVFSSGVLSAKTLTVRIYDDAEQEGEETFTITFDITGSTNAISGSAKTFTITINDNDNGPILPTTATQNVTVGALTYYLTSTNLSVPLDQRLTSRRSQFLYPASELRARGLRAGTINSFQLTMSHNTGVRGYSNFTVKMGATPRRVLYDSGQAYVPVTTTTVKNPYTFTPVVNTSFAANTITLDMPYNWDGTSSLVVELCYNNATADTTGVRDRTVGYDDTTTTTTRQSNFIWQDNIDCSGSFNAGAQGFDYFSGIKPLIAFNNTYITTGTIAATAINSTKTEYFRTENATNNFYFFNSNGEVLARFKNTSIFDYGCTQVVIDRAGTGVTKFFSETDSSTFLMNKTYRVIPTNNNTTSSYEVTFYFSRAEKEGWEAVTKQSFENIKVIKVPGQISSVTPAKRDSGGGLVQVFTPTSVGLIGNMYFITVNIDTGLPGGFGFGLPYGIPCTAPTFVNDGRVVLNAGCSNNDGNITIWPTGGTAPFMYSIDGGDTYVPGRSTGYTFINLVAGTYRLRLKDANGCVSDIVERTVEINCSAPCTPPTFVNDLRIVLDASCGKNDGNITIIPTSGTPPFMYSINGGRTYVQGGNAGYTFSNLAAGTYQLRLKDVRGCESAVVEKTVRNLYNCPITSLTGAAPRLDDAESPFASNKDVITTYPNPNRGQFKVLLQNFAAPRAEVLVVDAKGAIIQKRSLNLNQNTITDFDLKGKARGMYYIRVVSSNGTKVSKVLIQ